MSHLRPRQRQQGGFTLIELIVVIVILGILAAIALPKFAKLGGDARVASLRAARGALSASAAMIHGRWLLKPVDAMSIEGTNVVIVNGYPKADTAFATASGLSENDYLIEENKDELTITPLSVSGNATLAATCFISYAAPTGANRPPVFVQAATPLVCE